MAQTKVAGLHDPVKFATFTTLTKGIAKGPLSISGKWAVMPCTKLWAEAQDEIKALKGAGFKTFWVRGGKMGCRLDDCGLAAKV
jgi:hypothetical protein